MNFNSEVKMCGCKEHDECKCKKTFHGKPKWDSNHMHKKQDHENKSCADNVKGFNLCRRRNELRCFKQCEPISQPCDGTSFFNYFTSRTNFEFSGLIVVTNTGRCSMDVRVTDRVGFEQIVATVNPGASVPLFVEGLISLDIRCNPTPPTTPVEPTCSGEVIFDLEYCASQVCF